MKTTVGILLGMMLCCLTSCKAAKQSIQADSVILTEHEEKNIERIVITEIDTVTVFIEIPAQSAYRETSNSASHLETDFAISDTWLNPDGTLGHTLENKPHSQPVDIPVPKTTVNNNQTDVKIKEVPVPVPQPYPVEKKLTKWESLKIDSFWYILAFALAAWLWILKRPLISAIKKCL